MKYFKNTELAKLYHVSEKSVRNWIESAQAGKIDLQLHEQNGKHYIANVTKNIATIENQVEKGKKFKNKRGFRTVSPIKEFYDFYSEKQILDIIHNLTTYHEIPTHYSYVDGGAKYWDDYANRLLNEHTSNILTQTIDLINTTSDNVDQLMNSRNKVNVIDLGPGNGLPVRATLERLLSQGRLNRYIAIDASQAMLNILENNIKEWFGGAVTFEGHVRDFSHERFDDIVADDYLGDEADVPTNLVFLLGSTLNNFRLPGNALRTINSSLRVDDLIIFGGYLDTPSTRRYFDFSASSPNQKIRSELILGLLGIDESLYEIEQKFNPEKRARSISFKPKVDLSVKLDLHNGERYVELRKNEPILVYRHWHASSLETINQFEENGFDVMQATKSPNSQYILITSKIKTDIDNPSS